MQEKLESYRQHQGIAAVIYFSLNDYRTRMGEDGSGKYRKRVHGSTDLYGNVKPSYSFLRDALSPVVVESISRETGGQLCRIRCRNDIPSYAVSGYQLIVCDKQTFTETVAAVPAMKPGQFVELSIPFVDAPKGKIRIEIHRSTGFRSIVQEVEIFHEANSCNY
ncbi:hypothetical protein ACF3MZ_00455 [Paenibacillaceae bacterium WGS1546]|uniref:hypothetical protein n=1 Tax=Cohnella sp. WGS1546 TaxID=3366810 RepID=UPI00372D13BA